MNDLESIKSWSSDHFRPRVILDAVVGRAEDDEADNTATDVAVAVDGAR